MSAKSNLALTMGAIGGAELEIDHIHAELGEVLSGERPGRVSGEQISIYGGVGVPFQDLVVAWHACLRAEIPGKSTSDSFFLVN